MREVVLQIATKVIRAPTVIALLIAVISLLALVLTSQPAGARLDTGE